eukprot:866044-Pelagomonas_calceolata.AAC.4
MAAAAAAAAWLAAVCACPWLVRAGVVVGVGWRRGHLLAWGEHLQWVGSPGVVWWHAAEGSERPHFACKAGTVQNTRYR